MREYREFKSQQQRMKSIWSLVWWIAIIFILCAVMSTVASRLFPSTPEPTSTNMSPVVDTPTTSTTVPAPTATNVPVATPTPTSTDTPAPTKTPAPTYTPTATPSPEPSPTRQSDPQGDVGDYESGDPVGGIPNGVDIRTASVGDDLQVAIQPIEGVPAELAEWATEDEVLLWMSLYDPVPDPPTTFTDWVFVLDLDGDAGTGRPVGTVRVNPDLGYEVAIGVSYNDSSAEYEPYFLVWDRARVALVLQSNVPRFTLDETRTLVGLALPLESLVEKVEQTAEVTLVAGEVRGRAAAQSYAGGWKVADFYPDLPD